MKLHIRKSFSADKQRAQSDYEDVGEFMLAGSVQSGIRQSFKTFDERAGPGQLLVGVVNHAFVSCVLNLHLVYMILYTEIHKAHAKNETVVGAHGGH